MEVSLKLNTKDYPILESIKKDEMDKILLKIFNTGYKILFPPNDNITTKTSDIDISDKITSLESNLSKLIGLSSNSSKKGLIAENMLEELFSIRYGDIKFERKSATPHSGDAWLYLPDNKIIMLESKNYVSTINKDEIIKMQNDMITHNIKWGIFVSFNSNIQGMREMDFHTFTHNKQSYYVIMVSNLSCEYHKLDISLQIIRKLITNFDDVLQFPWVVNDINSSLNELLSIIQKNYIIRDNYYIMEKEINKLLSNYYILLRDHQYDVETKINEIINKLKNTIKIDSTISPNINIMNKYKDKKCYPLLIKILDVSTKKKWIMKEENGDFIINNNDDKKIATIKIQTKKILFNIISNDILITFNFGKDLENNQNLEFIKQI